MTLAPPAPSARHDAPLDAAPDRAVQVVRRLLEPVPATRRTWILHGALVALVLLAALAWLRPTQVVSADEGAVLAQAKVLATGSWSVPATNEIDETGEWFPLQPAVIVGDRAYAFDRPPTYALTVGAACAAGGLAGVAVLHLAALLVAALAAGRLAERIAPGRGIAALWLTAVLSPLLFDGYWAIAHTLVAAGATLAVLGVVRVVFDARWAHLATMLGGLALAVSMRNEPLIFAVALAAALLGIAITGGSSRLRALLLAPVPVAVAGAAYVGLNEWRRAVEGGSQTAGSAPSTGGGLIAGRIDGFIHSVLLPGSANPVAGLVVLVAAVALVGALVTEARDLGSPNVRRGLAVVAVAAAVARLAMPADLVTGLAAAAPLAVGAAFLLPADLRRRGDVRLLAVTATLTVLGVVATQHERGGTGEWGGRYFHVVLPLICVLAAASLDRLLATGRSTARLVVCAGLAVSLCLSGLALRTQVDLRHAAEVRTELTWEAAARTEGAGHPDGPVVVSTWLAAGRFAWRHLLDGRYLWVPTEDFDDLDGRLAAAGVPDLVLLAQPGDVEHLDDFPSYRVERRERFGRAGWSVVTLVRR